MSGIYLSSFTGTGAPKRHLCRRPHKNSNGYFFGLAEKKGEEKREEEKEKRRKEKKREEKRKEKRKEKRRKGE